MTDGGGCFSWQGMTFMNLNFDTAWNTRVFSKSRSAIQVSGAMMLMLVLFLTGCDASRPNGESSTSALTSPTIADLQRVPVVDTAKHSVPVDQIYFDTFQKTNRIVSLDVATPELIIRLRDAIPPIYEPRFESATAADSWLADEDIVIGYADGNKAFAYPVRIMNWHEMVSHEVNGRPIMATY